MKIYTRTGDTGATALFGGGRVPKHHPRVSAYGTVDELNSFLGRALSDLSVPTSRDRLRRIQHDLFVIGSHLSTPPAPSGRRRPELPPEPQGRVEEMEAWMDAAGEELEPLRAFILPGGTPGAAGLHVCRTVCRRAEREVVALIDLGEAAEAELAWMIRYLNRLSDLFFVLARLENVRSGEADVHWEKESGPEAEGGTSPSS
ncbi:MAG: cob(I)yrinic acid a,c-diamide adenosyltransferase [Gemmatimonadota bacterium]